MQNDPIETISFVCTIIFAIIAFFSFLVTQKTSHSDFFEIGYIVDTKPTRIKKTSQSPRRPVAVKPAAPKVVVQTKPKIKVEKQTKQKPDLTQFHKDCIDALISLGMRKKEATKRMQDIVKKYQPKTIQEFIQVAFKHEHN